MIFLSDGEYPVPETVIQDVCRSAVRLGFVSFFLFNSSFIAYFSQRKPLSFHSISFGPDASSSSLRRMADVALGFQNNASHNPRTPATASVPSSFSIALDAVRNPPTSTTMRILNVGPHLGAACGDVFGHCRVAQEATWLADVLIRCVLAYSERYLSFSLCFIWRLSSKSSCVEDCTLYERSTRAFWYGTKLEKRILFLSTITYEHVLYLHISS